MKKYYLSICEASQILQALQKIKTASLKSPVMLAALDIDQHELERIFSVIKRLEK